ncbi:hypothetical protein [Massilia genomosp. 1]|nr:hypothetical protein [Massilia genomosp. 1]
MNDIFINAILSDAAYARGLKDGLTGEGLENALSKRVSPLLVEYISKDFTVLSHVESSDTLGSGYDATMWKQDLTDKVYISFQGTYGLQDFGADAALAFIGVARKQVVDMINWWFRETGGENAPVRQIALWSLPPGASTVPPPEL